MDPLPRLVADMLPALVQRIGLHYRAPPPAIGVVVHLLLLIQGVIPGLVALDADVAPLLPPAQNGLTQHIPHHIRKEGHNINMVHSR